MTFTEQEYGEALRGALDRFCREIVVRNILALQHGVGHPLVLEQVMISWLLAASWLTQTELIGVYPNPGGTA